MDGQKKPHHVHTIFQKIPLGFSIYTLVYSRVSHSDICCFHVPVLGFLFVAVLHLQSTLPQTLRALRRGER